MPNGDSRVPFKRMVYSYIPIQSSSSHTLHIALVQRHWVCEIEITVKTAYKMQKIQNNNYKGVNWYETQ